jgi:hypothetical protein
MNSNQRQRRAGALAVVAGVAILATACGPARLDAALGGHPASGSPYVAQLAKFGQCVRGHGVPDFPDPADSGQSAPGSAGKTGLNPASPRFQAAIHTCHHLLPAGTQISISGTNHVSVSMKGS